MRLQVMCMPCTGFIGCVWGRKNPRVDVLAGSSLLVVCMFSKGTGNNAATCELCIFREKQSERGSCNIMQPWIRIWSCLSNENCVVFIQHCSRTRIVEHCINWSSFPARAARYNISCAIHTGGPHLKKSSKNADIVYHEKPGKNWGTPLVCFWEHKHLNGGDLEGCIFILYIYMYVCR